MLGIGFNRLGNRKDAGSWGSLHRHLGLSFWYFSSYPVATHRGLGHPGKTSQGYQQSRCGKATDDVAFNREFLKVYGRNILFVR